MITRVRALIPVTCIPSSGFVIRFVAVLVVAVATVSAQSQPSAVDDRSAGAITGTVSNTATGANLEGAEVTLQPGNRVVLTTREGHFILPQVPPGTYVLEVTYSGLDGRKVDAQVSPGKTSSYDIGLSSGVYQLSKFVVEGEREGNALAITQRRNAGNVKDVISSDAFGNVADLNLGNFLLRMPGVSKEESEGEIIRLQIRGIDSNMNAVSVDGTRGANGSTRDFNRGFEIDKVPADFIETIEITKAATPEMDADSIGGAVNLKTKSALDRKGRRFTYNFGNTLNIDQMSFRPLASISYSDVIRNKVGVLFTASYNESHKPRDRSNLDYERTTAIDRPVFFTAVNWGQDQLKHMRSGLGLRLDYKFNESTKIFFNTMYSIYEDQLNRRQPTLGTAAAANIVSVTQNVTETRNQTFTFNQNLRDRGIETLNFTLGGESNALWGGKLDFTVNYSPSKGTETRFIPDRAVAGVGFRFDRSLTHNHFVTSQISGPDILDPRNSTMSSLALWDNLSRDKIIGAQLNFRKPLPTSIPVAIKTGVRFREQKREQNQNRWFYSYVGPNGVVGPVGAANDDDLGRFFDPGYTHVAFNYPKGLQFMKLPELNASLRSQPQLWRQNLDTSTRDTIRQDGKASEAVTAAYVQAEAKLGRLVMITGVRAENTDFTGRGWRQEITPAERARRAAYVGPVTPEETIRRATAEYFRTKGEGEYRDYFPSVHFKYNFTRALVGRLSYSTGIGRPNFGQIIPTQSINNDAMTVTSNNPDLQPQYSRNLDAGLEYYFEPAGLLSAGVFRKNLRNFIYRANVGTLTTGNDIGDGYTGYTLTTDLNGGSAEVEGLELSYSQQFSRFGGWLRGFGAFANMTWLRTEGNYGTPGARIGGGQLPLFTPRTGNVGISYIAHGLTVRVKMNYSADRLNSFQTDPSRRVYDKGSTPIDVNLAYAIHRRLTLYADIINVFNTGTNHTYVYIKDRMIRNDLYTTVVKFGVSGSF